MTITPMKNANNLTFPERILWFLAVLCFLIAQACIFKEIFFYALIFNGLSGCLVLACMIIGKGRHAREIRASFDTSKTASAPASQNTPADLTVLSRLRQEKEDYAYEKEQLSIQLAKVKKDNESLTQQLAEAAQQKQFHKTPLSGILPPDENPTALDLASVASVLITDMEADSTAAGVRLILSCSHGSLLYNADERYIRLMFKNIIDNSLKYMRRSGRLIITISNTGSNLFLAFKDDGEGLPSKELRNIFDLNYQGTNHSSGSGLGLAQVKAIVEHYNGTVYARGDENGMGIYIQLPINSTN